MQLTYRGAHYDYTPRSAEAIREATVFRAIRPAFNLHYRGSVYTVNPNAEPLPLPQPVAQLVYRGATYALNGWTEPAVAIQDASSVVSNKAHFNQKTSGSAEFATVHRSNLHSNVQRRLQVARERGDQSLISLLERELQQIV